ncbi:hypothetical protein VTO42DRAFT_1820 [Malbranchea cinnamomea]
MMLEDDHQSVKLLEFAKARPQGPCKGDWIHRVNAACSATCSTYRVQTLNFVIRPRTHGRLEPRSRTQHLRRAGVEVGVKGICLQACNLHEGSFEPRFV